MKKLVSILLTVCLCFSVAVILTGCDNTHEHTYKAEWEKDTTHHWHACEGENCTDISDKAEHTWNDGSITTAATADADGIKTFTCTACGETKTEPVKYENKSIVTEDEWNDIFSNTNFQNVTVDYVYSSEQTKYEAEIKLLNGNIYLDGIPQEAISIMQGSLGTQNAPAALNGNFSQFTYVEGSNCYRGIYFVPNSGSGTDLDCEISFKNGVLEAMRLTYSNQSFYFSYSNFGSTTLN